MRNLEGEVIGRLNDKDFIVRTPNQQLQVSSTQPSLISTGKRGLPAVRILMIFPHTSGFRSSDDVKIWLQQNFAFPLGDAELATMLPNGDISGFFHSVSDLCNDLASPQPGRAHGIAAYDQLSAFMGRRAVIYVGGPHQGVPRAILESSRQAGALTYELGADPSLDDTFTNEHSPAGPPALGGPITCNPQFPPYVGINVVSGGYIPGPPAPTIDSARKELILPKLLKDIQKDGRGFYELTVISSSPISEVTLALRHLKNYFISAEVKSSTAGILPHLSLASANK